jgi:hypothetical protein
VPAEAHQHQKASGCSFPGKSDVNVAGIDAAPPALAGAPICLYLRVHDDQNHGTNVADAALVYVLAMAHAAV